MRQVTGRLLCGISVVSFLVLGGCQGMPGAQKKVMLFNGKDLSGWKLFVSDNDIPVDQIWSVRGGVVHCSGQRNGYMRTKDKYADYRLHLEWRWPAEPTNSGVLLHAAGPDKVWPRSIECQLKAGSAGDIVLMNGAGLTANERDWQDTSKQFVVIRKKEASSEKPPGQWNAYDIHCEKDAIRCFVNGVLQNEGTRATQSTGWICLQSEGGPIEFRNIYIEPLD
ncbi:MAG: 3-keto-disaccharide hydrolase [Planctomycetota bacterium]